jgi:hypothetical protein
MLDISRPDAPPPGAGVYSIYSPSQLFNGAGAERLSQPLVSIPFVNPSGHVKHSLANIWVMVIGRTPRMRSWLRECYGIRHWRRFENTTRDYFGQHTMFHNIRLANNRCWRLVQLISATH